MAMGYVETAFAVEGQQVVVEINGERYTATVVLEPLYDPSSSKMRA
ncbi:MAG: hypothetical protein HWE20_10200, partial [Gammaproteobacteria bacterium]|nr:hypothetical protein [Gammaproteobacteria bacterium]